MTRYSSRPLPAYAYRPGRDPHPTRDPRGHSFAAAAEPPPPLGAAWRRSDDYLYAVDLFNAGYYWEAHEALEPFWRAAGRASDDGRFLQAWIQLCAALLKHQMGARHAAARLLERARQTLPAGGARFGVDAGRLLAQAEAQLGGGPPACVRLPPLG